jgi:hypothetical protein
METLPIETRARVRAVLAEVRGCGWSCGGLPPRREVAPWWRSAVLGFLAFTILNGKRNLRQCSEEARSRRGAPTRRIDRAVHFYQRRPEC